jgi:N-acetylgalactosamine-N,N'-diacetylbacillosaminyl-diphospho-undecaprenol 4-alpha-N-acetylgalactosaminyltransferase
MKVVFIINSLTGGGAERIMARLLGNSAAQANGAELHLILLDVEPAAYTVPASITVHQLDTKGSMFGGLVSLWRKISELAPDICVSFLTRSNLLSILICRIKGIRCVISERVNTSSHHPHNTAGNLARFLTYVGYRHASRVIAVSSGIAKDLSENYAVPPANISAIPNPIDSEMIRTSGAVPADLPYSRPLVVGMGRLVPNKNFAMLIDAFAQLGSSGTLLIMGEGPLLADLQAQTAQLGLTDQVVFAGFRENPFSIIKSADCYVLPSNGEGFPNGLVEAMCLGTPVISTNCHSGPSEILDDRPYFPVEAATECKYGMLVPTNDAASLAEAMRLVLQPDQKRNRSKLALEGASRYALDATIAQYWRAIRG